MTTKTHKKLCWSCDGYVHVYEIQCPYCGVNLSQQPAELPAARETESLKEPAFAPKNIENSFQPPYQSYFHKEEKLAESKVESTLKDQEDVENPLASLLMLLPGSIFLLIGLTLLLFSSNGCVTFTFKSKHWYLYMLGAAPLLLFGWKSLVGKAKENKENL